MARLTTPRLARELARGSPARTEPRASSRAARGSTMLAIKKTKPEPGLTWSPDTAIPSVGPRDVLIAVTHAGICGTDRHIYEWDAWSSNRIPVGITIGHEFVGKVVEVGEAVIRTKVGDRVSAEG